MPTIFSGGNDPAVTKVALEAGNLAAIAASVTHSEALLQQQVILLQALSTQQQGGFVPVEISPIGK